MRNQVGDILIVKPSYREGWLLPGGVCELDEAPSATLTREVHEELGIEVCIAALLCVDYLSAHASYGESVHFLFRCEAIPTEQLRQIRLPQDELVDFRFCSDTDAYDLLVPSVARRLRYLARADNVSTAYLENGAPPLGSCHLHV